MGGEKCRGKIFERGSILGEWALKDYEGRVSWEGWGSRGRAAVFCPGKTAAAATDGFWFVAVRENAGSCGCLAAASLDVEVFAVVVVFAAVCRCSAVSPV